MNEQPFQPGETRGAPSAEDVSKARRLSEDLQGVLEHSTGDGVTFAELLGTTRSRGVPLVLMVMSLPFLFPIPLLGLSTPMGLAVMLFGWRVALDRPPLLPDWLLRRRIPADTLKRVLRRAVPLVQKVEALLKPRLRFLQRRTLFRVANGLALGLSGLFLLLPLPIPLTNTIPAWAVLLLAAGIMEEDGIFILLGYLTTAAAWIYLITVILLGHAGVRALLTDS